MSLRPNRGIFHWLLFTTTLLCLPAIIKAQTIIQIPLYTETFTVGLIRLPAWLQIAYIRTVGIVAGSLFRLLRHGYR
jgi:hypothetical protein